MTPSIAVLLALACTSPPVDSDSADGWDRPACPDLARSTSQGQVANNDIDEASGIASSHYSDDVFWIHNDSGDSARVFAVDLDGGNVGTFALNGADAFDWEDIAAGPDGALYIGDIGDNNHVRSSVTLYRFDEPTDPAGGGSVQAVAFQLTYPNSAENAETLLFDPLTDDVYILSKVSDFEPSTLYLADLDAGSLTAVAQTSFGRGDLPGSPATTAGDVSADGEWVVIATYTHAFAWPRDPAKPLHSAFDNPPCDMPRAAELQGEAITWTQGGGLLTVSEGDNPDMNLASPR